jgi:hypothetical protein
VGLDDVMARIAPRFGRVEPRRRARGYLLGLLNEYRWGADAVRDDLRAYVAEHLGHRPST